MKKNLFKPASQWSMVPLALGLLVASLGFYAAISGECLDPYVSCKAGWHDIAIPIVLGGVVFLVGIMDITAIGDE